MVNKTHCNIYSIKKNKHFVRYVKKTSHHTLTPLHDTKDLHTSRTDHSSIFLPSFWNTFNILKLDIQWIKKKNTLALAELVAYLHVHIDFISHKNNLLWVTLLTSFNYTNQTLPLKKKNHRFKILFQQLFECTDWKICRQYSINCSLKGLFVVSDGWKSGPVHTQALLQAFLHVWCDFFIFCLF